MKMGHTVPRTGIEPTSVAFRASVLTITPGRIPDITTTTASTGLRGQCILLPSSPWNCKYFNAYNYRHTGIGLTYTSQGRFNNHTAHSVYRIMLLATSVMSVMKMGMPRAGIESTSPGILGQCPNHYTMEDSLMSQL